MKCAFKLDCKKQSTVETQIEDDVILTWLIASYSHVQTPTRLHTSHTRSLLSLDIFVLRYSVAKAPSFSINKVPGILRCSFLLHQATHPFQPKVHLHPLHHPLTHPLTSPSTHFTPTPSTTHFTTHPLHPYTIHHSLHHPPTSPLHHPPLTSPLTPTSPPTHFIPQSPPPPSP